MAHFETGGLSLTIVYLQMAGDSRVFETHGHLSYLPNSYIRSADKQLHTTAARQQQQTTTTTISSSSFSFGSSKIKESQKDEREKERKLSVSALKLVKSSSSLISHRKKAAALHYKRIFNSLAPPIFIVSLNTLHCRLHPQPPSILYISEHFLFFVLI
jgi:hypothetical protein